MERKHAGITSFKKGNPSSPDYAANYSYDSFGNINQQVTAAGGSATPQFTSFQPGYSSQNKIDPASSGGAGVGYDAAGNVTQHGPSGLGLYHTYAYDAEGRVAGADSMSTRYIYDHSGNRVRKDHPGSSSDYNEYFFSDGKLLSEKHADGTWSDYIYADGKRIAKSENFDQRIHLHGVNGPDTATNDHAAGTWITSANGYVVRMNDRFHFRWASWGAATGGIYVGFCDNTSPNWSLYDQ